MKFLFLHIPYNRLIDLVEGELPPNERAHLAEHLAVCIRCSGEVAHLERLIMSMRTDTSEDAPSAVIARAVNLMHSRTTLSSTAPSLRRHIVVMQRSAGAGFAPAFGVRSGPSSSQRLLFSSATHDVDLRIEPVDRAWIVSGQVLGESAAGGWAELQGALSAQRAVLNQQNEFTLPPVPAGGYQLIVHLMNADVEVSELRIGA
jgi:anti-sigma factor RsiW